MAWCVGRLTGRSLPARRRGFYFRTVASIIPFAMTQHDEQANNPQAIGQYEQDRRGKRDRLRELGVDPYGGRIEGIQPLADVKASYKPEMGHDGGPVVKVAGRIVL